jgi:hypothetical protein
MTRRRHDRSTASTAPPRTPTFSREPVLDEAEAILADIEGSAALAQVRQIATRKHPPRQCPVVNPPSEAGKRTTPMNSSHLGIFWFVRNSHGQAQLLTVTCPLAAGEEYGDCLTSPAGHHKTWEDWRRGQPKPPLSALAPVIVSDEYEDWPRGRIVYERTADRFVIYADRQLLTAERLVQIRAHFHLPAAHTVGCTDAHLPQHSVDRTVVTPASRPIPNRQAKRVNPRTRPFRRHERFEKRRRKFSPCGRMAISAPASTSSWHRVNSGPLHAGPAGKRNSPSNDLCKNADVNCKTTLSEWCARRHLREYIPLPP